MKKIEAISIWDNGQIKNAEILNAYAVNVTLGQSATFYYSLMSADKMQLAQGNLTMTGDDYQAWLADDVAWEWIAQQLNLTILGNWVEPVVEHSPKEQEFINNVLEQLPEDVVKELVEEAPTEETTEL